MTCIVATLPAPSNVHYISQAPTGQLQIMWEPPSLLLLSSESHNETIDSRITHYIVFITTEESVIVNSTSETFLNLELSNRSCNLSFQVAAVNPAGIGEPSPIQTVDCELIVSLWLIHLSLLNIHLVVVFVSLLVFQIHTGCTDPTISNVICSTCH